MTFTPISDIRETLGSLPKNTGRSLLLRRISEARTYLESLERLQNDYSATAVLPDEILGLILTKVVSHEGRGPFSPVPWTLCVTLSSVCRTWRAVALQTPSFWANIPVLASSHFYEMAARSKEALFGVRLPYGTPASQGQSSALMAVTKPDRLTEFNVEGSRQAVDSFL